MKSGSDVVSRFHKVESPSSGDPDGHPSANRSLDNLGIADASVEHKFNRIHDGIGSQEAVRPQKRQAGLLNVVASTGSRNPRTGPLVGLESELQCTLSAGSGERGGRWSS